MVTKELLILPAAISVLLCGTAEVAALAPPGHDEEPTAERRGVTLYLHDSFRGREETFYGDDDNLRGNKVGNDRVSSVRVAPGCTVTLYQHAEYQGAYTVLRGDTPELGSSAVGNDAVSSLRVSCGVEVAPSGAAEPGSAADEAAEFSVADDPPVLGFADRRDRASFARSFQVASAERQRLERPALDPEMLEELTVMITVTFDDESVEHGAGVVLCQENRQAYVLTARHVLAGKGGAGGERPERHPVRTEIRFLHESVPSVVDDRNGGESLVSVYRVPDEDLALLSVPGLRDLEWTASASEQAPAPGLRPSDWARAVEPRVVALGYRGSRMETWAAERGTLLTGNGKLLRHSAAIVEGFSGGPLFHESGALIGVNLERIAGEEIGAEAGAFYGEALAMDYVLPRIGPWLPERCLRNMEEELERYQDAMAATVFFAEADKLKKVGSGRKKFRFGPYRITSVRGGGVTHGESKLKRKYKFSFDEADGTLWEGKCVEKVKTKRKQQGFLGFVLDEVLDMADVMHDYSLSCTLGRQGDEKTVELVIHERKVDGNVEGAGTAGAIQIEAAGRWTAASYVFYVGERILGAVTEDHVDSVWRDPSVTRETRPALFRVDSVSIGAVTEGQAVSVWLDPSVTGEIRSACVVMAAALLLHSGFELMAP